MGVALLAISPAAAEAQTGVAAEGGAPVIHIGIVLDGPSRVNELADQVEQEILTLTAGEFDVRIDDDDILIGDWSQESVEVHIDVLLQDPEVDLIIALGAVSSHVFCCREELSKPVIAAIVIDPEIQNLPFEEGKSGIHNLNYLAFPESVSDDIDRFREIVPFSQLTVVFNKWFTDAVPEIQDRFAEVVTAKDIKFDLVVADLSVDETLARLPEDTQAVYLAPLLHLSEADRQRLIDELNKRFLPTFSLFGVDEVQEYGVFAGQRDLAFWDRLSRRVALNVQRILLGEEAGEIPVAFPDRHRLTINMETARKIHIFPPWDVLTEAELLHDAPEFARSYTLDEAAAAAIEANLDIAAKGREVAAGAQEIPLAKAALKPGLDVGLSGVLIDDDRASSLSGQSEQTWTGSLTLNQLLFSEPARANVTIQGELQRRRESEFEQLELDIAQEAAVTYLSVLLSQTVERIRKNNLELTRSNLELARVRRAVGYAGPGEVYRWESELATARRDLVDAWSDRFQAKIALNRLLHRPQEEGYETSDVGLEDPELLPSRRRVLPFIVTPLHFEIFREFSVQEGLSRSPELVQLDAAIAAQERAALSARRAFRSPQVALQASLDRVLERAGEGSDGSAGIPGFESPDDTSWSLAVQASLPLLTGGERDAEVIAADETLQQLKLQREALRERLEQSIRSSLFVVNSSYAGIRYTREASEAAEKNLELVTDAYSRGAVDILDLLDAQNAALVAELSAASALYQFFIDLINVERAVNWFSFRRSKEEEDAWYERLKGWFDEQGLKPQPQLVRY